MNCLNGERYLREALDSVYAQTYQDWVVIFWDNLSTDRSADIASSYDERVQYHPSDVALPLGAARNRALSCVKTDYIAFLDTDDYWSSNKLEEQVSQLDKNPELGLIYSDVLYLREDSNQAARHFDVIPKNQPRGEIFGYLLEYNPISMPSVMLRTKALQAQPQWFDERFEIYPDYDLFRRIAHDWECDRLDQPLAFYRLHPASSTNRNHAKAAWELNETVKKLCALYPEMTTKYAAQTNYLRVMVDYQRGKSLWRDGGRTQAQQVFRRHPGVLKMFLAYWAAYFPYLWVEKIFTRAAFLRRLI